MKATVVLNVSAGSIAASEASAMVSRVREAFRRSDLAAEILAISPERFPAAARTAAASDADVVVLGGGDGTLSTGAAALLGSHKPLGILPLGSLNHFARDVGIPLDLDQAVGTIERGHVTEVDIGEVNGRIFLNNSSIGLYPSAVAHREELRHRHGGGKWPAMFNACVDVIRRFPLLDVTLQVNDRAVALTTPFIFVGNNRYEMSLFSLGTRTSLTGGTLSIYLTRNTGRIGLLRLAFRALLGRLEQDRDFHSVMLPGVEIRTRRRSLRVSLDGEVVRMASPIRYIIRPRALRVLVPMPDAAVGGGMITLAHISDLHFGTESPEIVDGLLEDLVSVEPALVVVSGDLTQRARRKEFMAARLFLDRIPFPKLVVPGNHDIPLFDLVTRFARPLARFRRYIDEDVDPFFSTDAVAVLGMNTARSNTWKDGRISLAQIDDLRRRLGSLPPHVSKVLVTHHPFLPPPGDPSPPLVGRAAEALQAAEAGGVDLVLAGHLHRGYTGDIRTHHVNIRRGILVAQAGTAVSHRVRNEANGYNVIRLSPQRLGFALRAWDGRGFHEARFVEYVKNGSDWRRTVGPD